MKRRNKVIISIGFGLLAFILVGTSLDAFSVKKVVNVSAEVKVNCTSPTHMYTEDCLLKVTNEVAKTLSELVEQEKVVEREMELLDKKRDAFNQSAFNLETLAN